MRREILSGLLALWAGPCLAQFSPVLTERFMVAGSFDRGLKDGQFWEAAFESPAGLAMSEDGRFLYVADTGNRCLRAVDLSDLNKVSTAFRLPDTAPEMDEVAILGGDAYFTPPDRKGLWKVKLSGGQPSLLAGASELANTVTPPLAVPEAKRVFWLNIPLGKLAYADAQGSSKTVAAELKGLLIGPATRLLLLNGQLYVYETGGRIGHLVLPGGLSAEAPPGQDLAATWEWVSGKAESFTFICAAQGKDCFVGWDASASGLRFLTQTGERFVYSMRTSLGEKLSNFDSGAEWDHHSASVTGWISGKGSMVYDPKRCRVYFSDTVRRNIVGWAWKDPRQRSEDRSQDTASQPHDPSAKRMFFVSTSLGVMFYGEASLYRSLWQQFGLNLNLLHAAAGTGEQYQLPLSGGGLDVTHGMLPFVLNKLPEFKQQQADWVVATVDHACLLFDLCNMTTNQQDDDVVRGRQDPEFATLSRAEREALYGPLTHELVKLVWDERAAFKGDLEISPEGKVVLSQADPVQLLRFPKLVNLLQRYEEKLLDKLKVAASAQGIKLGFIYLPFYGGTTWGGVDRRQWPAKLDLNADFVRMAHARGFAAVDLIPLMRVLGTSFGPLNVPGNPHFFPEVHPWVGRFAAEAFFKEQQNLH